MSLVLRSDNTVYDQYAISTQFSAVSTSINAMNGYIGLIISDVQMTELKNGNQTLYEKVTSVEISTASMTAILSDSEFKTLGGVIDAVRTNSTKISATPEQVKSVITSSYVEGIVDGSETIKTMQSTIDQTSKSITAILTDIEKSEYKTLDGLFKEVKANSAKISATATHVQSIINASYVGNIVDNMSTIKDMQSDIKQTADGLKVVVSSIESSEYKTLDGLFKEVKANSAKISATSDHIKSVVSTSYVEGIVDKMTTITKMQSEIKQTAQDIELKVNKNGIIAAINVSSESVAISASKIKLEGIVTANSRFKILTDGSMEATNGTFNGTITTEGTAYGYSAKTEMKAGFLNFYQTNVLVGRLDYGTINSKRGIGIVAAAASGHVCIGHQTSAGVVSPYYYCYSKIRSFNFSLSLFLNIYS